MIAHSRDSSLGWVLWSERRAASRRLPSVQKCVHYVRSSVDWLSLWQESRNVAHVANDEAWLLGLPMVSEGCC